MTSPDPVIDRQLELRLVCPAELNEDLGPQPKVPADAVIKHNASGGQYLDAIAARGARAEDLLDGAKAECARQGATSGASTPAPPAAPAPGAK